MKILITGGGGYIGWPLGMHLLARGHTVIGIDNESRRKRVREIGSWSATPIASPSVRFAAVYEKYPDFHFDHVELKDYTEVEYVFETWEPDVCIHLGEISSAPYSMIDVEHTNETMRNNILGTNNILYAMKKYAPNCHLLKLSSMGIYGTPNIDIPEGFFEVEYRGRKDRLPFPHQPGSYYHLSKSHDSHNIAFACKIWDLKSTDIMQGVVHGIITDEMEGDDRLLTRFDFDEIWGTALNRFCAQACIGHELTPHGRGGQTRGYIALRDSIQCLTIATENMPDEGEYRVFNQFDECYSVNELAKEVVIVAEWYGLDPDIWNIPNPRVEAEEHYYNPDREKLPELGFKPTNTLRDELRITIPKLMQYRDRIKAKEAHIMPTVTWK